MEYYPASFVEAVEIEVPALSVEEADSTVAASTVAAEMATECSKMHPMVTPATDYYSAAAAATD